MSKKNLMKAKNSFLGRVLRRLLGEEKGAVMMEYIVIALLIAAAAVVAVGVFGSIASGMFATLANFMTNQTDGAVTRLGKVRTNADTGATNAQSHVKTDINGDSKEVSGATTWGEASTSGGTGGQG